MTRFSRTWSRPVLTARPFAFFSPGSSTRGREARAFPAVAALHVVERLGPATSPPVVLLGGDPELAAGLRQALVMLSRDASGRYALDLGLVERYAPVNDSDYDAIRSTPGVLEGVRN